MDPWNRLKQIDICQRGEVLEGWMKESEEMKQIYIEKGDKWGQKKNLLSGQWVHNAVCR